MGSIDQRAIAELEALDDGGPGDFVGELIALFLSQMPQRLERLNQAVGCSDSKAVCAEVHKLKSSSAYLGAKHLSGIAESLEDRARAGDLAQARASLVVLTEEFARVADELCAIANARKKKAA